MRAGIRGEQGLRPLFKFAAAAYSLVYHGGGSLCPDRAGGAALFASEGRRLLKTRIVSASIVAFVLAMFILGASGGLFNARSHASSLDHAQRHAGAEISEAQRRATVIDYRRLDSRLQMLAQQPNMIGLAVGVVEDGDITFLKGYGETVAGSGDPVTPDTVFRWASLSKGVAADLVTKL